MGRISQYNFEIAFNDFNERGYDLLETEYKNTKEKMKYRCRKHPDKIREIRYRCLREGQGCKDCADERVTMKESEYHKRIKNDYCKSNNIDLVRVPYKRSNITKQYIEKFLNIYKRNLFVSSTP